MVAAGLEKILYAPLESSSHIRLLEFHDERSSDGVTTRSLQISQHHLDELPKYTAVSYTWGCPITEGDASQPEWEDEICFVMIGSATLSIRKNLMLLLRKLAQNPRDYFWIDAICIDQQEDNERAVQVMLMAQIYSQAEEVLVWMGEDEEAPNILRALKDLYAAIYEGNPAKEATNVSHWMLTHDPNDLETIESCGMSPEQWKDAWRQYFHLFDRYTWFHRAWVLQEVQAARKIQWWCHDQYGDLDMLCSFTLDLYRADWPRQLQTGSIPMMHHNPAVVVKLLQQITPGFQGTWRRFASQVYGAVTDEQCRYAYLLYMIQEFRASGATRPVDKIYSTLSIAATAAINLPDGWPIPDYNKPAQDVFTGLTTVMLSKLPVMAVLSLVEPREERGLGGLPSWVPDFTLPLSFKPLMHMGASLIDEEIPDRADVQSGGLYNASLAKSGELSHIPTIQDGTFCGTGAPIGSVEEVLKVDTDSMSGLILLLLFCSDLPEKDTQTGQPRSEALCRTLVADRFRTYPAPQSMCALFSLLVALRLSQWPVDSASEDAQISFMKIMKRLAKYAPDVIPEPDLLLVIARDVGLLQSTEQNVAMSSGEDAEINPEVLDAAERIATVTSGAERYLGVVQLTMSGRVLFRTTHGHVGFAHHDVVPGDSVWLLQGGRSLYILKEQSDGQHIFKGESYLHGFMQGEALTPDFLQKITSICLV